MKKTITYCIIFILITLSLIIIFIATDYYITAKEKAPYTIPHNHSDTLRIAYIGDSWAFFHQQYDMDMERMAEMRLQGPVHIESYGICGLTSREIYESLFENKGMRAFLMEGWDVCFVSAGINDSYKKMSSNYYQQGMDCIIRFLLANNIRPIIFEIPDYDIEKAYQLQTFSRKALRQFSMMITGTKLDCKQKFREALNELIAKNGYQDKVEILRFKEWNQNFVQDQDTIYTNDGMHLNKEGYQRLDSCIIELLR